MNIREKYSIPEGAKILLYVGNISKNKNQEQMIDAFGLLPESVQQNTYVLFCGRNLTPDYTLDNVVASKPYNQHLVLCGNVDKKYMGAYYKEADGVVLLSHTEGFGLSLIEGMHFGKPCITFTDLDAYEDIYNESAVIGLNERTDDAVAKGLLCFFNMDWDHQAIIDYSKSFAPEKMAEKYMGVFKQIIN